MDRRTDTCKIPLFHDAMWSIKMGPRLGVTHYYADRHFQRLKKKVALLEKKNLHAFINYDLARGVGKLEGVIILLGIPVGGRFLGINVGVLMLGY